MPWRFFLSPITVPRKLQVIARPGAIAVIVALILLGAAVYSPGLPGGFVFDDYANIVDNSALQPDAITFTTLINAAVSSDSGPLKRPLASLSFLANYHFFGVSPFSFKITNLVVHLINGCLVFWLLCGVLPRILQQGTDFVAIAGLTAIVWTVHPINLTAVLYIVQRMTSLAATFTLLAMICYVRARARTIDEPARHNLGLWGGVFIFSALAVLTKECALLLPVFLALIELTAFRFRAANYLRWLYSLGAIGAIVVLYGLLGPLDYWGDAYRAQSFTIGERVLTELRILVFYLGQVLLPDPTRMTLLHADWPLSRNLWTPWTTAAAAGVWSLAIAFSVAVSKRYPIVLFGIGWYLVGHLLESTVIPLELIFEHRNYLPSVGVLCLVCVVLIHLVSTMPAVGRLVIGGLIIILSAMTAYRAWQWSDPLTLSLMEARHNPTSARARYENGRRYFQLYLLDHKPELLATTRRELWSAIDYGNEDFFPLVGLVNTYVASHQSIPADLMRAYERELREEQPTARRLDAVRSVINCQIEGDCPPTPEVVLQAVSASLDNPRMTPVLKATLLEWLALYYSNVLGDLAAARSVMNDAVVIQPDNWSYRLRLFEVMLAQQDWPAARQESGRLESSLTPWARFFAPTLAKRFDELRRKLTIDNQKKASG